MVLAQYRVSLWSIFCTPEKMHDRNKSALVFVAFRRIYLVHVRTLEGASLFSYYLWNHTCRKEPKVLQSIFCTVSHHFLYKLSCPFFQIKARDLKIAPFPELGLDHMKSVKFAFPRIHTGIWQAQMNIGLFSHLFFQAHHCCRVLASQTSDFCF